MEESQLKIVFMGTPQFAVPSLEKIHSESSFNVVAVYTAPDKPKGRGYKISCSPIKEKALNYSLPVFTPKTFKNNTQEIQNIANLSPDLIIVVAYGLILPRSVLQIPKYGAINLHPSLLPKYRGAAPIQSALLNGDKITGNTIILMNERMDAGDILTKESLEIFEDDNYLTLHNKLANQGAELLVKTVIKYVNNQIKPIPQDENLATYTIKITTETAKINWAKTSFEIHNLIRAMYPDPCAWTIYNGERIKLLKARYFQSINSLDPDLVNSICKSIGCSINEIQELLGTKYTAGTILLDFKRKRMFVVCGYNSLLEIIELQRAGRSILPCAQFLMGIDLKTGCKFDHD